MTERVYLHVGAMKTGTSYLQGILAANRESLGNVGVLVPSRRSAAVHDVLDYQSSGRARLDSVRGSWDRLVSRVHEHDGSLVVLSHEYLSLKGPPYPARVVSAFEGLDVHVVVTVRDATGTLPAQWQTFARNRGTMTWPEYAAAAVADPLVARGHSFLYSQRLGRILRQWGGQVPGDRVHVVTVPPPSAGRDVLWERFAEVIGLEPDVATDREVPANSSAGYATAHLLCLVHRAAAARGLARGEVRRLTVHVAGSTAAQGRPEPRPPLDRPTLEFTAEWNGRMRQAIGRFGSPVVGSLDDLPVLPDLDIARPMVPPSDESVLEAARGAFDTLAALSTGSGDTGNWDDVDSAVDAVVDLLAEIIPSDDASGPSAFR